MKHCERALTNNEENKEILNGPQCDNATKNFEEIKNLSYSNFYCKFKLKKNRKIGVVPMKRTKKYMEKMIVPPMAPKNTTQYLTKIRETSNGDAKKKNFLQKFTNENTKKRLNSTADNSPFSFTTSSEGTFGEEKNSNNWKNEEIEKQSFSKCAKKGGDKLGEQGGEILAYKTEEKNWTQNIFQEKDYSYTYSKINFENSINSNEENDSLSMSGNEFFMGSTMKSIVESITKSKSKIFSKSLILDGDDFIKENQPQLKKEKENEPAEFEGNVANSKNNMNLKLRISDFFPNIEQNLMENLTNPTNDYLTLSVNDNENSNFYFQENFFSFEEQINGIDFSEKSTSISAHSKPFMYFESSSNEHENDNENDIINPNEISSNKEENKFFLLGKKKRRKEIDNKKNKPFSVFRKF